jgi:signal transduction histidine kinase
MDIRLVLKAVLVNSFSLVLAIFFMVEVQKRIPPRLLMDSQVFMILFFSAVFLFILIRGGINFIFSKVLLRHYYVFRNSFSELNIFLHEGLSTERIISTANKYLKQGLGLAWIYYFDVLNQKVITIPNKNPIIEGKITTKQIFDEQLNIYVKTLHTPKFFYGAELEAFPQASNSPIAILPLWNKGELRGYFVLGPQLGLTGLSFEEIQQLHHAWAHMETAFDRALLYEGLEQKVQAQVKDVTYKNKKLKELVKNRLDFIQLTSHQLRTPITSLSGALQLLLHNNINDQDHEEMIQLAYDKSKELTAIVDGVLKLARLEKGEDPKDTNDFVNLNEVFASLLPVIEASAHAKGLSVEFEPIAKATIVGNKLYLEQAFYNLLENAIHHTQEGGIKISFKEEGSLITTSVSDSGTGIPLDLRERIFSRRTLGTDSKGTGLGLYIAKTIIDAHPEGKIWFESDSDGTTFLVSLKKFHQD